MSSVKIAIVGAGSSSFGPTMIRDVYSSERLSQAGPEIWLMDIDGESLKKTTQYCSFVSEKTGIRLSVKATVDLREALESAKAAIVAIEKDRFLHWSEDFHIPNKYGFRQPFGECGGPGGAFHALRNMTPMLEIARTMEAVCPDAYLINFTNPEGKLCEALNRLTTVKTVGLCHGIYDGLRQLTDILRIAEDELDFAACGMNHFTWFQRIRRKDTGEDLYPKLAEAERQLDWTWHFHEIGLSRILFRRVGLWPSPGPDHCGEYLSFGREFVSAEMQYFYDPMDGEPRNTGEVPEFIHLSQTGDPTHWPRDRKKMKDAAWLQEELLRHERYSVRNVPIYPTLQDVPIQWSREAAIPIIESLFLGRTFHAHAVNIRNDGAIPGLENDMIVEVPAVIDRSGIKAVQMDALPEFVTAVLRLHGSINKLLVQAYQEKAKNRLVQALMLDPAVNSYRNLIYMVNEMLEVQKGLLPPLV